VANTRRNPGRGRLSAPAFDAAGEQ